MTLSAFLNRPSDLNSTVAMLGPLQDNGGPTFTNGVIAGAARPLMQAILTSTPPPNYDQRGTGFDRVTNGRIDIGAFEQAPCNPILNGGFENGGYDWVINPRRIPPRLTTDQAQRNVFARTRQLPPGTGGVGNSAIFQAFIVPAGGGTLSFWHWDYTTDSMTFDYQDVLSLMVSSTSCNILPSG